MAKRFDNFYHVNDRVVINLDQVTHGEVINDPMNPSRHYALYFTKQSSADRVFLNKEESLKFLKYLDTEELDYTYNE
jgi:hypothetical protein